MISTYQMGVSTDRIRGSPGLNLDHLECCICHEILWKPVACQSCETPFCSACIRQWLNEYPAQCPNRCQAYNERKCPPFVAKVLSQLKVACVYDSNGCEEIISYEALDKHEVECGFQLHRCSGCQSEILKKDLNNHEINCEAIEIVCPDCRIVYKRGDATKIHTETVCLKEQLRQLRNESKENKREIHELNLQLHEMHLLSPWIKEMKITFDDLPLTTDETKRMPIVYRGLKWNNMKYGYELYLSKKHPKSGYINCFTPGSSPNIAFFKDDVSFGVVTRNDSITFYSLTACAAWNDDLQLTITGYRGSVEINRHTVTLLFGKPQFILLNWKDVEKIILKSAGGTAHPDSGGLSATHVILTQLTIGPAD
ncbi:unnamed protein product [Rotaria socialis]